MCVFTRKLLKYNVIYQGKKYQHIAYHYNNTIQLSHYSSNNIHYITQHKT